MVCARHLRQHRTLEKGWFLANRATSDHVSELKCKHNQIVHKPTDFMKPIVSLKKGFRTSASRLFNRRVRGGGGVIGRSAISVPLSAGT